MTVILALFYKDINSSCYSSDGKTLQEVTDPSPYLRISAKCEIIQVNCFYNLSSLKSFSFEDNTNLTTIGENSFYLCLNLTLINLSSCKKLTKISSYAFYDCDQVTEVFLPKRVLEIGSYAFYDDVRITRILIPASVERINKGAFSTTDLRDLEFEEGSNLTSIEANAFEQTKFTSFEIPESVTKVSGIAFNYRELPTITIHRKNKHLVIESNKLFSSNKSILFLFLNRNLNSYVIPESVTVLGEYSFYMNEITSITLHNSVTTLKDYCFYFCSNLITLTIPESVKYIGEGAFTSCTSLINVTFLGQVDQLGLYICSDCRALELIIFPNSPTIFDAFYLISSDIQNVRMAFTHKTLFSYVSIQTNVNISVSYLDNPNLIITTNLLVMNYDQTILYEF
ncbi:surface antigen BspA-like [Trichomonas vaginalis G3]|uniref:Surface antigen BspA-like n=1 Tax=Trichomonas vaginalis (strain ATCC PRA-98 / G3) TaxID=412133 RepID=A2DE60_TRIV3|nr:ribonuclease inhibitor domain-containing protein [Trichomonas vaginalis G3]EAY21278.1 surface antigen BspA-like [Trichomonas vaginalis G3]KAI5548852.1 ribonuclease inhibitor domain-containing protein [Trichomonas vaginalis G3]|eukprot:XP_001582264.1 surface antigen BspA-like [Trichomonas vaginalis G3]